MLRKQAEIGSVHKKGRDRSRPFSYSWQELTAGAAALPTALIEFLIALTTTATLPSRGLSTAAAATLPAALTTLSTLTALSTLLLAVTAATLPGIIRVASHKTSSAKVDSDSGELLRRIVAITPAWSHPP